MRKTPFAGLTELDPGEPLSVDGSSFTSRNPSIIDLLLRVGAQLHRHNGLPALADPGAEPGLTVSADGGALPADTTISACYTLVDEQGGETLPSAIATVTTEPALEPPATVPDFEVDYTAGQLVNATYYYGFTLVDAAGGETPLGATIEVVRDPGSATARVMLSGLAGMVADNPGAVGWRIYRAKNNSGFDFLAAGVADAYTDDGMTPLDCGTTPPEDNTTNSTNSVTVNVPADAVGGAFGWRLYLAPDGDFTSPALYGATRNPADAGTDIVIPLLALAEGAPPDVATTIAGASKIDPDTDMLDFPWKRPVATAADLPADATEGDMRVVKGEHAIYLYTAGAWGALVAGTGGGGGGGALVGYYEADRNNGEQAGTDPTPLLFPHEVHNDGFTVRSDGAFIVPAAGFYSVTAEWVMMHTGADADWAADCHLQIGEIGFGVTWDIEDEPSRASGDHRPIRVRLRGQGHIDDPATQPIIIVIGPHGVFDAGTFTTVYPAWSTSNSSMASVDKPRICIARLS